MNIIFEHYVEISIKYSFFEMYYSELINKFIKNNSIADTNYDAPKKYRDRISATYIIKHNKTGKLYIGSTGDIYKRIYEHKKDLVNNNHSRYNLQKAYNSDKNISFFILLLNNREEAYDVEQWLLDRYWNKKILFNINPEARSTAGSVLTKLHKRKIGVSNKNKKVSDFSKEKMSISQKERYKNNPLLIEKIRIFQLNRHNKDLTLRQKLIDRCKGKKHTLETKEKISKSLKGRTVNPLALLNMSKGRKGKYTGKYAANAKSITIDNVKYDTMNDAAKALNINRMTLRRRIKSKKINYV